MSSYLFSFSFIGHILAWIKFRHDWVYVFDLLVTFLLLTTNTALYYNAARGLKFFSIPCCFYLHFWPYKILCYLTAMSWKFVLFWQKYGFSVVFWRFIVVLLVFHGFWRKILQKPWKDYHLAINCQYKTKFLPIEYKLPAIVCSKFVPFISLLTHTTFYSILFSLLRNLYQRPF